MKWNDPFVFFLTFCIVVWGAVLWFARGVIAEMSKLAAANVKTYAPAYAKGGALIAIAVFTAFDETFSKLDTFAAKELSWWSWLCLFLKSVTAGAAVFVAFMDSSIQRIREHNEQ